MVVVVAAAVAAAVAIVTAALDTIFLQLLHTALAAITNDTAY